MTPWKCAENKTEGRKRAKESQKCTTHRECNSQNSRHQPSHVDSHIKCEWSRGSHWKVWIVKLHEKQHLTEHRRWKTHFPFEDTDRRKVKEWKKTCEAAIISKERRDYTDVRQNSLQDKRHHQSPREMLPNDEVITHRGREQWGIRVRLSTALKSRSEGWQNWGA